MGMCFVECTLEGKMKTGDASEFFKYQQLRNHQPDRRTRKFRLCAGSQQKFSIPTRAPKIFRELYRQENWKSIQNSTLIINIDFLIFSG
jgi:hypothetical protein